MWNFGFQADGTQFMSTFMFSNAPAANARFFRSLALSSSELAAVIS
jgi:hypothetical protein